MYNLTALVCADVMIDADSPDVVVTSSSDDMGVNPVDALKGSNSSWSPDPDASEEPTLTLDLLSSEPAEVTTVSLDVENVTLVEVIYKIDDETIRSVSMEFIIRLILICPRN